MFDIKELLGVCVILCAFGGSFFSFGIRRLDASKHDFMHGLDGRRIPPGFLISIAGWLLIMVGIGFGMVFLEKVLLN